MSIAFLRAGRAQLLSALLAAALFASPALAQRSGGADPARLAAARELMEATGVTKQMDGMAQVMSQAFRQGATQQGASSAAETATREFNQFLDRFKNYREPMLDEFAVLYAERFTAEELKAIAEFYRSGPGARFIAAMPELMQAGSQIGTRYAQKALADIKAGK